MMQDMIFLLIAFVTLWFGFFVFTKPVRMFEIQKNFYRLINWNIEPISMEKEIRNTRIMGAFLIVFALGSIFYYYFVQ